MNLWIVGKTTNWPVWEFQGVFDDYNKALDACKTNNHFVGPATLNEVLSEETTYWPGAYYPLMEPEPVSLPAAGGTEK